MTELRIYNRNIFGVPIFARKHGTRIRKIAEQAMSHCADVIFLQEVFMPIDRLRISKYFASAYKIKRVQKSYFRLGGGLCGIFKNNLRATAHFIKYYSSGFLTDLTIVDKIAEKGFQIFEINDPVSMILINTHLTCPYVRNLDSSPKKKEMLSRQLKSIKDYLDKQTEKPVIIIGDFNLEPHQDIMCDFINEAGLVDHSHGFGKTIIGNFYSPRWLFASKTHERKADYVLTKNMPESWKILVEKVDDHREFVSDHIGVMTTVKFN